MNIRYFGLKMHQNAPQIEMFTQEGGAPEPP